MENVLQTVGVNLWRMRREAGYTRDELAEKAGVSVTAIKRIEEMRSDFKVKTLELLAGALGVEVKAFFEQVSPETKKEKRYDLQQKIRNALYPDLPNEYHMCTLREFLLYLPLVDRRALADALSRIHGQVYGYEGYVLEQLNKLYETIPASLAKVYADTVAYCDTPAAQSRHQDEVMSHMTCAVCQEGGETYTQRLHEFLKQIDATFLCE